MYLTSKILNKYNACGPGAEFFEKHYPDGIELVDLIKNKHVPYSYLYWGYNNLDINEDERAAYFERIKVTDSMNVYNSHHVDKSQLVCKSEKIQSSTRVNESKGIEYSQNVNRSEDVDHSEDVCRSSLVSDSNQIVGSVNVTKSVEVLDSSNVSESNCIYHSTTVVNSEAIFFSKNIIDCKFCFGCTNLKECMFCYGMHFEEEPGSYYIFNKKVDKAIYDAARKAFAQLKMVGYGRVANWIQTDVYTFEAKTISAYKVVRVPEKFVRFVNTLPNYDEDLLRLIIGPGNDPSSVYDDEDWS